MPPNWRYFGKTITICIKFFFRNGFDDIDDLVFSGAVRAYAKEHGLIKVDNSKKLVKSK